MLLDRRFAYALRWLMMVEYDARAGGLAVVLKNVVADVCKHMLPAQRLWCASLTPVMHSIMVCQYTRVLLQYRRICPIAVDAK